MVSARQLFPAIVRTSRHPGRVDRHPLQPVGQQTDKVDPLHRQPLAPLLDHYLGLSPNDRLAGVTRRDPLALGLYRFRYPQPRKQLRRHSPGRRPSKRPAGSPAYARWPVQIGDPASDRPRKTRLKSSPESPRTRERAQAAPEQAYRTVLRYPKEHVPA